METVKSTNTFKEFINSKKILLGYFYADWCAPCKAMDPILDELDQNIEGVTIIKIDAEKKAALTITYQVKGIPTLILFKNGREEWRHTGAVSARDLKTALDVYES